MAGYDDCHAVGCVLEINEHLVGQDRDVAHLPCVQRKVDREEEREREFVGERAGK